MTILFMIYSGQELNCVGSFACHDEGCYCKTELTIISTLGHLNGVQNSSMTSGFESCPLLLLPIISNKEIQINITHHIERAKL